MEKEVTNRVLDEDNNKQEYRMSEEAKNQVIAQANKSMRGQIEWSEYFRKKANRLNKEFIKELQESADNSYVDADAYGAYREGTFLHSACVVKVARDEDNGLWVLQILSEQPITLPIIKQIRYKFLPNDIMVTMMLPPREMVNKRSVMLYEMPANQTEEE